MGDNPKAWRNSVMKILITGGAGFIGSHLDISKIRNLIGFDPRITLEETIRDIIKCQ